MFTWIGFPLAGALILTLIYLGLLQDRSRGRPRCPKCWYNMTGAPSLTCPECGHDARTEKRLYRTRRRRWAVWCGIILAGCSVYAWQVRVRVVELKEPVTTALRPTSYLLLTLQYASAQDLGVLHQRFKRSGVWTWEGWLLVWQFDRLTAAVGTYPPTWSLSPLLMAAARDSRPALDRVFDSLQRNIRNLSPELYSTCTACADRLTDHQLSALLDTVIKHNKADPWTPPDSVLVEMIRRHRPEFREQIARWVANPRALAGVLDVPMNLELVTALRRMDGQPDPLRIFVGGAPMIECKAGELPTIQVTIRNVDAARTGVYLEKEHDDRRGRRARWRFDVRDEQGRPLPIEPDRSFRGAVLFSADTLGFGGTCDEKLEMGDYVPPLKPGRYRVTVQYSNACRITDHEDVSRIVVFTSDPFELIVRPSP